MDLSLCLTIDLMITFPLFTFAMTVVCPHIAARIVAPSRLQHEARHDARTELKDGRVPAFIEQRLLTSLARARFRLANRDKGECEGECPQTFNPITSSGYDEAKEEVLPCDSTSAWTSVEDPVSQTTYYYNTETGKSQWELPWQLVGRDADADNPLDEDIELGDLYPTTATNDACNDQADGFSANPLRLKSKINATVPIRSSFSS